MGGDQLPCEIGLSDSWISKKYIPVLMFLGGGIYQISKLCNLIRLRKAVESNG